MSDLIDRTDLRAIPPAERLRLIEELWDSLTPAEQPPLEVWHRAELDRRLDALESGDSVGAPWSDVRMRILGQS